MVEESPALPLLVRADGRIEGPSRLAGWFGLDVMPGYLSELDAGDNGLDEVQLSQLNDAVRKVQKALRSCGACVPRPPRHAPILLHWQA